jgi:hypothetical protein
MAALPAAKDTVHIGASELAHADLISLGENLRIETFTADSLGAFGRIAGIAVSESGDIVVLDEMNSSVIVFDSSGALRRTFGRPGQGPGEFHARYGMGLALGGDTVFVLEQVLHAFALNGSALFSGNADSTIQGEPRRAVRTMVHTPRGVVVSRNHSSRTADGNIVPSFDTTRVQLRPNGAEYFRRPGVPLLGGETYRLGSMYSTRLLGPMPSYAVSRTGRIYYSRGAPYVIDVLNLDGELESQIVAVLPPVRLTASDFDRTLTLFDSALAESRKEFPADMPDEKPDFRKLPRAEHRAVVGRIIAGDEDAILVERLDMGSLIPLPGEKSHWDVISLTGGIMGRFTMTGDFKPIYYRAGELYGVLRTTEGAEVLVRYAM